MWKGGPQLTCRCREHRANAEAKWDLLPSRDEYVVVCIRWKKHISIQHCIIKRASKCHSSNSVYKYNDPSCIGAVAFYLHG